VKLEAKLKAARKRARETSAQIDEGLLGVSKGIDRLLRDRAELIAAAEAVLEHIDDSQGSQAGSEETGSDFFDGAAGTDARRALETAVEKAKTP
jgi:hypothetical protein